MNLLQAGAKAPDFSTTDQSGKKIILKDYRGKKVVLYFYPKDDTPGCTKEACAFRDHFAEFKKLGIEILGVSVDSEKSHKSFAEKFKLPTPHAEYGRLIPFCVRLVIHVRTHQS